MGFREHDELRFGVLRPAINEFHLEPTFAQT